MISASNFYDSYEYTPERLLLTQEQHHIPGIATFGHHLSHNAFPPINWHYHENCFEFSLLTRGTFTFSTQECDYHFSGGETFISYPNEIHGTNNAPMGVCDFYWFQLNTSDENNFLFLQPFAARSMIEKLNSVSQHVIKTESKKTIPLMEKAFQAAQNEKERPLAACLLQLFLHLIVEASAEAPHEISPDIRLAVDYIQKNVTAEFSLEQLSDISSLSCSQFKQKFKKQLGMTPRYFINLKKIEYAKTLLLEGKSVTDISMLLNFSSSSYFSAVFKKYTLYSPKDYLRKNAPPLK